jgi:RNA polymerase sigma-70 factor (ECF subfamily)
MSNLDQTSSPHEFLERHLQAVWRYLRMHGASTHEADDLTQETFVIALRKDAMQLAPRAARTFLRKTARFTWLHHLRRTQQEPELCDAVDALWDRDAEHDGGADLMDNLHNCISKLDGRAKLAVQLSYGIGDEEAAAPAVADRADVASELELTPNGLKTLLQRSRQLLRSCLERARQ